MWRSIGTVNPSEPKHNRSRDQGNFQPFAQASRLRLNQSQLSGEAQPPQFLNQYFVKKRSPQGLLQRALSQKNIQTRPFLSPPSSPKQISPKNHLKSEPNQTLSIRKSIITTQQKQVQIKKKEVAHGQKEKQVNTDYKVIQRKVKTIKGEHSALKSTIAGQLDSFRDTMKQMESEMVVKLEQWKTQQDTKSKEVFSTEQLGKMRTQTNRFSERMRQLDIRKKQIQNRYRQKLLQL